MTDDVDSEWWNRFFAGPWLEVQRSAWGAEETLSDAQTIERLLRRALPDRHQHRRDAPAPAAAARLVAGRGRRCAGGAALRLRARPHRHRVDVPARGPAGGHATVLDQ